MFTNAKVQVRPKHCKPFGCPVCVLDPSLQEGKFFHKWKQRSRVRTHLGPSPQHSRNVALVLDQSSGHASPQFYVKFNPSFHAAKEPDTCDSLWQNKAGFVAKMNDKSNNKSKQTKSSGSKNEEGAKQLPDMD